LENVPFLAQKSRKNVPFLSKNIGKMFQKSLILIEKNAKNNYNTLIDKE